MVRWIACLLVAGLAACEPAGEPERDVGAGGAEQAAPEERGMEEGAGAAGEAEQEAGEAMEEEEAEGAPLATPGGEPMGGQ